MFACGSLLFINSLHPTPPSSLPVSASVCCGLRVQVLSVAPAISGNLGLISNIHLHNDLQLLVAGSRVPVVSSGLHRHKTHSGGCGYG